MIRVADDKLIQQVLVAQMSKWAAFTTRNSRLQEYLLEVVNEPHSEEEINTLFDLLQERIGEWQRYA